MDKISISDFCGEEKTYAQLIQDLYFHISVKELYMVLASNAAQNRDVYESVSYRNTYSSLENRIPDVCRMTVGELLRYATEKCLSGRNMEELQFVRILPFHQIQILHPCPTLEALRLFSLLLSCQHHFPLQNQKHYVRVQINLTLSKLLYPQNVSLSL